MKVKVKNDRIKNKLLRRLMYEILHETAPWDELDFYLSYARKGMRVLEPLCGSGRFFVPFLEKRFNITGMDLLAEMLKKLKLKAPNAHVIQADITEYDSTEKFDYIFITSGAVSLFTDIELCKRILRKIRVLLTAQGRFVFAVDTVANQCSDDQEDRISVSVQTKDGFDLTLKSKNRYDALTQTQFSPGVYELYDGEKLLQREPMNFQTYLYRFGEMEEYLREAGFTAIKTYSSFDKEVSTGDKYDMFLFECGF